MFKLRNITVCILILMLALSTGVFMNSNPVSAEQEETVVYVDPPLIKDLPPTSKFNISVKVANVTNLWAFDIKLTWNPEILGYISHEVYVPVETYPDGLLHEPVQQVRNTVNVTGGTCWVAYSSMSPAEPFNGSGTAFLITFEVKSYGSTPIVIEQCKLAGYGLPPPPIPFTKQDGFFTNFVPPPAKLYVNPPSTVNHTLIPCKNYTIHIEIEDVYFLSEFQFWLTYNTTILDTLSIEVNPQFPSPVVQVFEGEGKIEVSASTDSVSGNFTLASITFHITGLGGTILDLGNVTLIDDQGQPIEYEEPGDGYFDNVLKAKIFVDPPELIDPTAAPGSNFSIQIKMQDALGLYGYQFQLSYDSSIITYLGAIIFPPNNDTNFNTYMEANDTAGFLIINVTYYPPAEPITIITPKTITIVYFQVKNYGSTPLDLQNTEIIDPEGRSIPHTSEDGFFATITADVAIIWVETSPKVENYSYSTAVYPGRLVNITVIAANLGDITCTFNVTVYYNTTELETQTVLDLPPEQNVTLIFIWNTTGTSSCNIFQIKAEASHVEYEVNLENNVFIDGYVKIKMLGDVNGDGSVDIYDVAAVTVAYGSQKGDPTYNPEADIAPEWELIDIFDVATVLYMFGQTC